MSKRWLIGCGALLLPGFTAFFAWQSFVPSIRINRQRFDQIQIGMTRQQVENIIGVPPGRYLSEEGIWALAYSSQGDLFIWVQQPATEAEWLSDLGDEIESIRVFFDEQGKVVD